VQKAVELGAAAVWPLLTERVVAAGDAERQEAKTDRWRKIAREAARQCGADWIPEVRPPMDLPGLVAELHTCHRCFVGALTPDAVAFRQAAAAARPLPASGAALMIVIGPEGDLAPAEMELLTSAGGIPVSFGAAVLRVETAALYALSLMHYEFLSA
jgi:16S rRNA (uracil1498-N3)-methyltransferase